MSDNEDIFDDVEDEDAEPQTRQSTQPADLRKQNSKLARENRALQEKLATIEAAQRRTSVADFLETHGANKKWAKYVDISGDVTSDSVLKWLQEEGTDLGWTPPEDDTDEDEIDRRTAARRVNQLTTQASNDSRGNALTPDRIKAMTDDELIARLGFQKRGR